MANRQPRNFGYGNRKGFPPPARPPVHEGAPAVRVQNLQKLTDWCGKEHLAMKIGIPLGRLAEMLEGVNFGPEQAYHMEVVLRLPSGFMDRPGASLDEAGITQLRALPEDEFSEEEQTTALGQTGNPKTFESQSTSQSQPTPKEASVTLAATPELQQTPVMAAANEEVAREIRRANFEMLTQPKGVKSRLTVITGLSPANISHRLHGHKIFDAETGEFFCQALKLPSGWFESPRSPEDIPQQTMELLTGGAPFKAAAPSKLPKSTSKTALTKPAGVALAPTRKGRKQATEGSSLALSAASLGTAPARKRVGVAAVPQAAVPQAAAPVVSVPAVAPAVPAAGVPGAAVSSAVTVPVSPAAIPLSTATPVAQAYLMVLTKKVQEGRLPEQRALELLQEALVL